MQNSLIAFLAPILSLFIISCSVRSVFVSETFSELPPSVSQDSISHSIFLIGDAGEPSSDEEDGTFHHLKKLASIEPSKNTIVFLGDNLYPRGLPEKESPDRKEMERRLDEQILIGETSGALTIFVPGNHDWEYQGRNGAAAIRREEEYIESKNNSLIRLLPQYGFPGPAVVDIGEDVRIIAIDTQWWLHQYEKPYYPNDLSEEQTKKRFIDSLAWAMQSSNGRRTIVVAHHPLRSHGEHGGFFDWKDHLFPLRKLSDWLWIPLPGIGSLYPISRMLGISDQDFSGSKNAEMRKILDRVLSTERPLLYASGHDHNLQVLQKSAGHYYAVSGNGIAKHNEGLTTGDDTILATRKKGFMRLDFLKNGNVRLSVIAVEDRQGIEIFSMIIG